MVKDKKPEQAKECGCFTAPHAHRATVKELGMDEQYREVSILICTYCGQRWLRVHDEVEGFTASGRWCLGAITAEQASLLTAQNAKATLEGLPWYFYGGSYFDGRVGRASGTIW